MFSTRPLILATALVAAAFTAVPASAAPRCVGGATAPCEIRVLPPRVPHVVQTTCTEALASVPWRKTTSTGGAGRIKVLPAKKGGFCVQTDTVDHYLHGGESVYDPVTGQTCLRWRTVSGHVRLFWKEGGIWHSRYEGRS
jgi:hypothetical protein